MPKTQRYFFGKGNALVEYALPAGILVLGAGVMTTMMNVNGLLGQFYAKANGDSASAISGGRYTAKALGVTATGTQGNGAGNFSALGGSGGFAPGIEATGNGLTSSGSLGTDPSLAMGQSEVLPVIQNAKDLTDVYNAVKKTSMPDKFKGLIQAMAEQQRANSFSADGKPATGNLAPNGTVTAMLMYAANPANAAQLAPYGSAATAAFAKAMAFSGSDMPAPSANISQMAQAQLLKSMNITDPSKSQELAAMMSQNPSMSYADLYSAMQNPAQFASQPYAFPGSCATPETCPVKNEQYVQSAKAALEAAQGNNNAAAQAAASGSAAAWMGVTTAP